ncbi:MAG: YggS family pyridoxal phosphate-dependent enzyme, partial [Pseudomonadota bacterium]
QPLERVETVLAAGQRVFGENRVQEAAGKWPAFRDRYPGVTLHLIGPLQTNKVKQALGLFDVIQTLDREKLARKLADAAQTLGHCPPLFVEVNTGAEPQKAGVLAEDAERFIAECRAMDLPVTGVMAIPPAGEDPVPHFRILRAIRDATGLTGLSMGMSADFEAAIAEGATHVRVGSALFGDRVKPA